MKTGFRDRLGLTIGEAEALVEQVAQGMEESLGTLRQGQGANTTPHVFLASGNVISQQDFGLSCCTLP